MLTTSSAKIYLADQRGFTKSNNHQSFHTFNFGSYVNEHRQPFSSLQALNDEILVASKSITYTLSRPTEIIIFPLVGHCLCSVRGVTTKIDVGEIFKCSLDEADAIELTNPFKEELINYLYIELSSRQTSLNATTNGFEIESQLNHLHKIMTSYCANFYLGIYDGREEAILSYEEDKQFFVYVIEGAFEVNKRLLHRRDSLALWDTHELEFEALSNQAIILVVELH